MRILVSGGLGFVGINLVRDLALAFPQAMLFAADVLPADEDVQAFLAPVRNRVQIRRLDVRDRNEYESMVTECGCTHLVHAAAVTPDLHSEKKDSPDIVDINLVGAINALCIAHRNESIQKFIFISSSGVYGFPEEDTSEPIGEDDPLQLGHLYGICKYSAEMLTTQYAAYTGKLMASLRLASIYGPLERVTGARTGMSIPRKLQNALEKRKPINVYGKDMMRDWLHTADVSRAVEGLFRASKWHHTLYNVGAGETMAFTTLLSAFIEAGLVVQWVDDPDAADIKLLKDDNRQALAIDRLKMDTGFTPAFTGISGIKNYIQEELKRDGKRNRHEDTNP